MPLEGVGPTTEDGLLSFAREAGQCAPGTPGRIRDTVECLGIERSSIRSFFGLYTVHHRISSILTSPHRVRQREVIPVDHLAVTWPRSIPNDADVRVTHHGPVRQFS
jgi:hypothetical protein